MARTEHRLRLIPGTRRPTPDSEKVSAAPQPPATIPAPSRASQDLASALRASEQRLSALLEDRGRLGRDLHDCVLQSLYAIGLSLAQSGRQASSSRSRRTTGDQVVDQLNHLIHEIRQMITGLERGTVEAFDLASELRMVVDTYRQAGGLAIALDLQRGALDILTGEEERDILNIVREALSNCARHAGARHASVVLQARGSRVRLTIEDDGAGFDPAASRTSGYGLANMAARAKKLGGQLTIRSQAGRGTKVIAEFVLEPLLAPV